jgi:hypothetical protein
MLRATVLFAMMTSCVVPTGDEPVHDEPSDLDPVTWSPDGKADFSGVPGVFEHNAIVDNTVFTARAVDADAIQAFLESSPYSSRSWLADYRINGARFSDRLVEIAVGRGLDPVMLLVRLQVEQALVSKTARPSSSSLTKAMGCGCADGSGCSSSYSGFDAQLQCAADVYKKLFEASHDGTGQWRTGHASASLDHVSVTPRSDATAAIYAYTPWVLPNRGGAWLTWNVTRRYLKHFDQAGTLSLP